MNIVGKRITNMASIFDKLDKINRDLGLFSVIQEINAEPPKIRRKNSSELIILDFKKPYLKITGNEMEQYKTETIIEPAIPVSEKGIGCSGNFNISTTRQMSKFIKMAKAAITITDKYLANTIVFLLIGKLINILSLLFLSSMALEPKANKQVTPSTPIKSPGAPILEKKSEKNRINTMESKTDFF